jgi:predicted RNA binding protein YcfA (HicA-like mRNA interferase family)
MVKNSKELIKVLKKKGWEIVRTRGSHVQMKNMATGDLVTIPHPKKDLPIGTLKAIYKSTGLQ